MRHKLTGGAAGLALLIAATAGLAQGQAQAQDRGRGGGEAREAPRGAPDMERSRPQAEPRVQRAPERQSVEQPQRQRPQRAEPRERERQAPQRVERQRPEPKREQASPRQEQPDRAPGQKAGQKAGQKDAPDRNQARNPEQNRRQFNRAQASNEQRGRVRERIFQERGINRIARKDFGVAVSVGGHVHRRHRLHHLTPAILAFAPIYVGYSYIVVEDTICIVDPETYIIVDVIPSSLEYADGPQRPQLALSADEMRFIYASVPKGRTADVRIRLALGAEIPSHVDLERFPDGVIDRVPRIEAYRYIVVDADVVVVDPYDRSVALVVTE